jgi:hypothetical protein
VEDSSGSHKLPRLDRPVLLKAPDAIDLTDMERKLNSGKSEMNGAGDDAQAAPHPCWPSIVKTPSASVEKAHPPHVICLT